MLVDPYGVLGTVSQRGNIQFLSVGADSISARGVSGAYGMLPYGVWVSVSQRTNVQFVTVGEGLAPPENERLR